MKRTLLVLVLAVAAAAGGYGLHYWLRSTESTRRPDFTLMDLDGRTRSVAEWDGKLLLVNFWAPWCGPCRKEMPMLIQLQKDDGPKGLQIVGLALDEPDSVRPFATQMGVNYPVLVGLMDILRIQEAYGDTRLPYSVLVNRQGLIVFTKAGELTPAEIESHLKPLL